MYRNQGLIQIASRVLLGKLSYLLFQSLVFRLQQDSDVLPQARGQAGRAARAFEHAEEDACLRVRSVASFCPFRNTPKGDPSF